jgi:hypothetical protein
VVQALVEEREVSFSAPALHLKISSMNAISHCVTRPSKTCM